MLSGDGDSGNARRNFPSLRLQPVTARFRTATAFLVLCFAAFPGLLLAQPPLDTKQPFVAALVRLMTALPGSYGDEGPSVAASIEAMDAGLRRWDATLDAYQGAMSAQIGAAPPAAAAQMCVTLGAVLLERGRVDDALRQFAAAARLDPKRADVHLFSALAYQLGGRDHAAAAAFRTAWTLDPADPVKAYLFLQQTSKEDEGRDAARSRLIAFQKQRESEDNPVPATPFLTLALIEDDGTQAPTFPPAAYTEGFSRLARGDYAGAIAEFRQAAAADPLSATGAAPADQLSHGIEALRQGKVALAQQLLAAVVAQSPESSEARRLLSTAFWFDRQYDRSVEQLEAAVRLRPADERSRLQLADVLVESGQHDRAEQELTAIIAAMPASGQAHWRLGQLYHLLSRDGDARQEFERAAALPALAGAGAVQRTISRMYLAEANLDRALESARRRVALEPNAVEAHKDLGDVYRKQSRDDDALVEFLIATLLDPLDGDAYGAIGQIHLAAERYGDASEALRRAVKIKPGQAEAQHGLATALIRLGMDEEGKQQLAIAQRLQNERLEAVRRGYQVNLLRIEAALRTSEGKFDAAARLWQQVADREPNVFSTYVSLGQALANAGQHASAIDAFERALQISDEADVHGYLAAEYRALGRDRDAARAQAAYEERREQRLRARGAGR